MLVEGRKHKYFFDGQAYLHNTESKLLICLCSALLLSVSSCFPSFSIQVRFKKKQHHMLRSRRNSTWKWFLSHLETGTTSSPDHVPQESKSSDGVLQLKQVLARHTPLLKRVIWLQKAFALLYTEGFYCSSSPPLFIQISQD